MKNIAILVITVCVMLVAGCTTTPATPAPSGPLSPAPVFPGKESLDPVLPMNGNVTLGSGNNTIDVSLFNIEVDPSTESGTKTITINVLARNTGTNPRQFVWFSKLTNMNGNSFGGIGISHAGSGARSGRIPPGIGEIPRDYIEIHSAESFATLSRGAVLDVYFMEKISNETSKVPDYHVAWTVDPGVIR
jgi:hypothetical protein